ncbi:MAG: glycosyltransferase [Bacteroidales bacterium]|nr:glycosyltransferase [Bacteroidales bacterium]
MKKILVAADMTTHPCIGGNNQCVMQYVKCLKQLGFDVYYLLIGTHGQSKESVDETLAYWGDHIFYYKTPKWQFFLQRIYKRLVRKAYPNNIDFYYPCGLNSYVNDLHSKYDFTGLIVNYIWESRLAFCNIPIRAIYTHDVFAFRDERMCAGSDWHHYSVEEEAKAIRRFPHVLAIQDVERDYFKFLAPKSKVLSVYSGFTFVDQPVCGNKNILFFSGRGKLNIEAITKFINEVFPLVLERDSDIHLLLGGQICSCFTREELHPNIELKGSYESPDDFYGLGDIVINPVFEGSGLKIKTFEAIAHGKVTIVDPHSAVGIYKLEKSPLLIAAEPQDYVDEIKKHICSHKPLEYNKAKCKEYIEDLNKYISSKYFEIFK